ncbi:MAG: hydrogenase maturation nickel metallochaperone HypA [Desulfurivibrio sp.]|nr:hydrogenase maturation nickel metallochaperone HypA [Desulfurivibrio sp.]MBU4119433.1 hydrogenase maturation nickel metallochaperone HypA [Pseudomonadota bacterium]
MAACSVLEQVSAIVYHECMHEMSLAVNIVELVSEKAQSAGGMKVTSVELEAGKLSGVMVEALVFCFDAASRNTPVEGARLEVREVDGLGNCLGCGYSFALDSLLGQCPQCDSYGVETVQGRELKVVSFTIDEE